MPYKLIEQGGKKFAEVDENGLAIFVHADGTETPFDPDGATARIAALNKEQADKRGENNTLKQQLKRFEGIDDPDKAKEALQTVANLEAGELKTAKQVQEIKEAARIAAEQQVADANKKSAQELIEAKQALERLEGELHKEKIGGGIARSKFVTEKLSIPPDMVESFFGRNLKLEDGKIVGYDSVGNKLYSKARPGELADLDESLHQLVDAYPNKENILKGAGGGSGGGPGAGDRGGLSKEAFDKLTPVEKMNISRGVRPAQPNSGMR